MAEIPDKFQVKLHRNTPPKRVHWVLLWFLTRHRPQSGLHSRMLPDWSMVLHPDIKSNTARLWHYAQRSKTGSVMASDLAEHLPEFSAFYVHRHIAMPKQYNPLILNSANEWHYLKPVLQFRISAYAAWPESV